LSAVSALTHLECSKCRARYDAGEIAQLCVCGAPLLARYDLERAARTLTRGALRAREATLWRYEELLPVRDAVFRVSLHENVTPIVALPKTGAAIGIGTLLVKDEGRLPTGTFKARGAAVGVSRAKELGVRALAMPTNGNAGGAWAAYAAQAGIAAYVVMPQSAPSVNRMECALFGANLFLVDGLINDAGRIVADAVSRYGFYDASTLKEPYRIEGKKTMGFELVEQLDWRVPDVVVYPTGGGVGIIGIYKALRELAAMGLVESRMPRFVAVQAEGCAPIVRAWEEGRAESTAWTDAQTVAFGINVPKALGDFLVLEALYETNGAATAVSDAQLLAQQALAAREDGMLFCPEGAATLAAAKHLRENGWIASHERVLLVNTGAGFKEASIPYPQPPRLARDARLEIADR
jgi:threonine synthase